MVKGKTLFSFFILMLVIIPSVFSLTASISNPRMVLYKNITDEKLVFENSVIVNNKNDFEIEVEITPTNVWKNIIDISEKDFVMGKKGRKEVPYTINIEKPGYYRGDILVSFKGNDSKKLSLAQDLVVIVKDKKGNVPRRMTGEVIEGIEIKKNMLELPLIIGSAILILIILIIIFVKRK